MSGGTILNMSLVTGAHGIPVIRGAFTGMRNNSANNFSLPQREAANAHSVLLGAAEIVLRHKWTRVAYISCIRIE
jgi:hypothetical protein